MYSINFPLNERCLDIVSVNKRNIGDRERTECSLVIFLWMLLLPYYKERYASKNTYADKRKRDRELTEKRLKFLRHLASVTFECWSVPDGAVRPLLFATVTQKMSNIICPWLAPPSEPCSILLFSSLASIAGQIIKYKFWKFLLTYVIP